MNMAIAVIPTGPDLLAAAESAISCNPYSRFHFICQDSSRMIDSEENEFFTFTS